jgi:hypothetical protein
MHLQYCEVEEKERNIHAPSPRRTWRGEVRRRTYDIRVNDLSKSGPKARMFETSFFIYFFYESVSNTHQHI